METEHIPTSEPRHWRADLEAIVSLGAAHAGVHSLGELAQARREHLGQFFTPLPVVELAWQVVERVRAGMKRNGLDRRLRVLDNSVGSGRMLHFADPQRDAIAGIDVHAEVIADVMAAAAAAGFEADFIRAGMEGCVAQGHDVALINPPFSLALTHPNMVPFACTTWGRFGRQTAATSDEYALAHALNAAQVVIAVLPMSTAIGVSDGTVRLGDEAGRLAAVLDLGTKVFLGEGANVHTALVVFADQPVDPAAVVRLAVTEASGWQVPLLGFEDQVVPARGRAKLHSAGLDETKPAIAEPVTGNKLVRVTRHGRRIKLHFQCGFMKAKCLNRVYRQLIQSTEDHRLPTGVRFSGEGQLDIEVLLASGEAMTYFEGMLADLRREGADVVACHSLLGYLEKRARQLPLQTTPFGRWIQQQGASDSVQAVAKVNVPLDPKSWVSPMILRGTSTELTRQDQGWCVKLAGRVRTLTHDEAVAAFEFPETAPGWIELHKPLQQVFPQQGTWWTKRAQRMRELDFLNWGFQFDDAIEMSMRPTGAICGWKQGLGKARLAAAMVLLRGCKHGLITMPAFLLDEFPDRLRAAGIPDSDWQVIETVGQATQLRRINVISNERLRGALSASTKRTYAKLLRNRIGVMVCDEGEFLANADTAQSRAVAAVNPKILHVFTGTPMPNYPRDLLRVASACAGDAVAHQPYGLEGRAYVEARLARSMAFATRGLEAFGDDFVTTQWVTREFSETLSDGAKREVPKVANLPAYRQWLGPLIKRRLPREPEVAKHVQIADPIRETVDLHWDTRHLGHYLRIGDEFVQWWNTVNRSGQRCNNLVALLARISAVEDACNVPQRAGDSPSRYAGGLTSKQRWVVDRCEELQGSEKIVVFARAPLQLDLMAAELRRRGVATEVYHGNIARQVRRERLQVFRHGRSNVLLASYGITRSGLDLYQATRAIFASRLWSAAREDQAVRRLLRPQQTRPVVLERPHLLGSIDEYQDQLCAWKERAEISGIDYGTPMGDDEEFLHLDTVLGAFVENLAARRGLKGHDLREQLKEAA